RRRSPLHRLSRRARLLLSRPGLQLHHRDPLLLDPWPPARPDPPVRARVWDKVCVRITRARRPPFVRRALAPAHVRWLLAQPALERLRVRQELVRPAPECDPPVRVSVLPVVWAVRCRCRPRLYLAAQQHDARRRATKASKKVRSRKNPPAKA